MNYILINKSILSAKDVPQSVTRNNDFYDYLFNNSVAYYYSTYLSEGKTNKEKAIISAGNILNKKFLSTLKLVHAICKKNKIPFLLFKSYKYFHEVIDNDIDILLRERDYHLFINALKYKGFSYKEEEYLKGECIKIGFCKIEPRVNASIRGQQILDENILWKEKNFVRIGGLKFSTTSKEVDLYYQLLSILYTPSYLKLYTVLVYKTVDIKKLFALNPKKEVNEDLKYILQYLKAPFDEERFPRFLGTIDFVYWWCKRVLLNTQISFFKRFTLIISFFYSKYSFLLFRTLTFRHPWPLRD